MQTFFFLPQFTGRYPKRGNYSAIHPVQNTVQVLHEKDGWKIQLRSFTWKTGNKLFRYEMINPEGLLMTYSSKEMKAEDIGNTLFPDFMY